MEDEKLRKQIGANIVSYRKRSGLTQARLAEKLNYSDKAVSKWERGESVPDVLTLTQLAELFDVSVNDLLQDPNALPDHLGRVERVMEAAVEKTLKRKANKTIILLLSSTLVWFVALLIFVVLSMLDIPKSWIAFLYALPANAIVMLSLRSAWKDFRWNRALISIIMWGGLASLFASLMVFIDPALWTKLWRLFLLGIPGQAAILLWFEIYRKPRKEKTDE
ncbi:MAG: helix-turn-helix transcriptional regulator [Oscillospiraceae bacterium]|nr:helix-turn-helix transcriptional regulator [Oscillospiraceae bacterium]